MNARKSDAPIIAYKAFDKHLTCSPNGKPFQYEVGKIYTHTGNVQHCRSGFHACESPLDVLGYYCDADTRFAVVELFGAVSREKNGDTKIAAASIFINTEISLAQLIAVDIKLTQAASGDSNTQAASGDYSKQAASGYASKQAASGYASKQAASGCASKQAASGCASKQAASGDYSTQAASGDYSKQELNGENGVAVAAGLNAKAKAAEGGCFALRWDDTQAKRPRVSVAYVGENGIKADTWYTVNGRGEFVEVAV